MKTNAFKYLGIALMALMMISLTSCEVEIDSFYDDDNIGGGYYSRSSELCSRTWISYYRDADGNRCCQELDFYLAYIIHSGFISGYQNRYGDNLKPPTNVYHRMTA